MQPKKFNFQNSKQKYYKNIKTLLDKINYQVESQKENKKPTSEEDTGNVNDRIEKEEVLHNFSQKLNLNQATKNNLTEREEKIFCENCNKNLYKYICPKCKIKYCSVECYKSHNVECTEDFYKRNVIEEMKATKEEEKDSTKFRSKLKEMYERIDLNNDKNSQQDLNSVENVLSKEREKQLKSILKKLENGTFDFSSDLNPSDWKEFQKFMDGYLTTKKNEFLLWEPFWLSKIENEFEPSLDVYDENFKKEIDHDILRKIKDYEINEYVEFYKNKNMNEDNFESESNRDSNSDSSESELELENLLDLDTNDISNNFSDRSTSHYIEIASKNLKVKIDRNLICKSILLKFQEIPSLHNLTKLQPSDSNILTMVYILSNILFLFKLYNGEVNDNLEEIIEFLIHNCKVLYDKNKNFLHYDLNSILNEFFEIFNKSGEMKNYKSIRVMVLDDLLCVTRNRFYIFEALIRLYEMLHRYIETMNSMTINKNRKIKSVYEKLIRSKNKIIYYMSYVKCLSKEKLDEVNENLVNLRNVIRNY